jgi:hypothetical protein
MDLKKQTVVELQFVDHHFGNLLGPDDTVRCGTKILQHILWHDAVYEKRKDLSIRADILTC